MLGLVDALGYEWLPQLRGELAANGHRAPDLHQLSLADGFEPLFDRVDVGVYPLPLILPDGLRTALADERPPWVALAADHRLAGHAEIRLSELRGEPAIAPPAHEIWDHNVALILRAQDLTLALEPATVSMYEVMSLVSDGRGWSITATRT